VTSQPVSQPISPLRRRMLEVMSMRGVRAMTCRASALDALEPQAGSMLSPRELSRRGIAPGGRIRVETRRGAIELGMRADTGVPENMVFILFCFVEAAANLLTNPKLDPFGKIPEFKFCAARIAAVSGRE
jgi:formate dehydrogenase major subunit